MVEAKKSREELIIEFEEVLKQEDVLSGKLRDYLFGREIPEKSSKSLTLEMLEIQSKKRQIHRELRRVRKSIH